jgi:hypothetical protein
MSCQMCEKSSQIKWKCINCDYLLCTNCYQLHRKVKSLDDCTYVQEILSIGDQFQKEIAFQADVNCFLSYLQMYFPDINTIFFNRIKYKSLVWPDQGSNTQSTTYKVFGLTRPELEHTIYHIQSLWFDPTRLLFEVYRQW